MCYQSIVIFPYDVITTQLNDEWMVWMDAKKEKAVFKGGHVIATQGMGGVWVQEKDSKLIDNCQRQNFVCHEYFVPK